MRIIDRGSVERRAAEVPPQRGFLSGFFFALPHLQQGMTPLITFEQCVPAPSRTLPAVLAVLARGDSVAQPGSGELAVSA